MEQRNDKQLEKPKASIKPKILAPSGWDVLDSDMLLKLKIPEQDFLVKSLIPEGGITMLSGNPGCGKSWLMLEIAKCVGCGDPLFTGENITPESINRFKTKEAKVLYIDEESHLSEIKRRWKMLKPPIFDLVHFMSMQDFKIDDESKRKD